MIITYFTYLCYQQPVLMLIPTHTTFVDLTKSYWSVVPLVQKHALILTIHLQCVRCDVYRDASASLDLSGSPNMENAFRNVSVPAIEVSKEVKYQQLFQPCACNKCEQLP